MPWIGGYWYGTAQGAGYSDSDFEEAVRLQQAGYTVRAIYHSGGPNDSPWDWTTAPLSPARAPVAAPPVQISTATGIDPSEVANALYGKPIPLSALGLARIGTAGLIFGPYFNSGLASFAVSFGFPANPAGTRYIYEISLDSKVAWENAAGNPAGAIGAGFTGDAFEARFYSGTMTQGADPLEAAMFGAEAVAYRPQMMLWFINLPIAQFDNKVPFVSAKIGDVTAGAVPADGLNLGDALQRVAYSPWLEYTAATFEATNVGDIVQAMILTEDQTFLDLLRVMGRVYRTIDILQTDKLRINDRGSLVTPDVTFERDHITADAGVQYTRVEETSVPRELELLTIDPDADYVFMPSKASRPRTPVPVTASVARDSITLPVVIGATTRASLVTFAKYEEDNARKRIALQAMLYGYALEPGDLFRLSGVANDFDQGEMFKVITSSHGANYINEISGEAILKCSLTFDDTDSYWSYVLYLLHANSGPPFIDSSPYAVPLQVSGDAVLDTSIRKYGAGSVAFDGAGLVAYSAPATHLGFSPSNTSPFTIELWARFDHVAQIPSQVMICCFGGVPGFRYWRFYQPSSTTELTYHSYASASGSSPTATVTTSGAGLANGIWYHLAVDKDSTGKIRIYVNGAMKASAVLGDTTFADPLNEGITVGGSNVGHDNPFFGHIDDARITSQSRYGDVYGDAGFLPSGIQFPDSA